MDLTITMRICDICKSGDRPTSRYVLTTEQGGSRARDLCDEDAAPVRTVFGEDLAVDRSGAPTPLESVVIQTKAALAEGLERQGPAQKSTVAKGTSAPKLPAKKAAAKKAAAKKGAVAPSGRRSGRTPVMTMDEIEAMKQAKRA